MRTETSPWGHLDAEHVTICCTQRRIRHSFIKEPNPGGYCPDIPHVSFSYCFVLSRQDVEAGTQSAMWRSEGTIIMQSLIKNLWFATAYTSKMVKREGGGGVGTVVVVRRREFGNRCNHVPRVGYWFRERTPIGSISTTSPARHPRFTSTERVVSKWEHVWDLSEREKARLIDETKGVTKTGFVILKSGYKIWFLEYVFFVQIYFLRLGIYRFVTCARFFIIIADSWVLFRLNGLECVAASLIRADWKI